MLKKYFILVVVFIITCSSLFSQELSVESKTVERGFINLVNVYLRGYDDFSQMSAKIKFNSYFFDIKSVKSAPSGLIQDEPVNYTINSDDLENSFIEISSSNISTGGEILCSIEFEALAGPDSVAYFTPFELIINGNNIDAEFTAGKISVGIPLFPIETNSISSIYPNPVIYQSVMDIDIKTESSFELVLYSYYGGISTVFPGEADDEAIYLWSKASNSKISINKGDKLPVGSYKLYFTPLSWYYSAQAYYMVVKIGRDVFRRNFIIIK